jgi:hypothetical protein
MGVPELLWYTDIEQPLDPSMVGTYPCNDDEHCDGEEDLENEMMKSMSFFKLESSVNIKSCGRMRQVATRRVSVSSSESDDVDIKEVLKEVVRDYTATHSRSTRPAETSGSIKAKIARNDLIFL